MAEFQTVLGIVLIVTSIVIISIAVWNIWIGSKATTNDQDTLATITDSEKKGLLGANVILIIIALVLGVYGVVVILPSPKMTSEVPTLRASRSLSGTVLTPSGRSY
jgi:p-aminobenzoyl-glutamate transporter AbgT